MSAQTTCKSCGAPILWAKTSGGKNMPLDANPERRFVLSPDEKRCSFVSTYVAHWSTCPNADVHRKRKVEE